MGYVFRGPSFAEHDLHTLAIMCLPGKLQYEALLRYPISIHRDLRKQKNLTGKCEIIYI